MIRSSPRVPFTTAGAVGVRLAFGLGRGARDSVWLACHAAMARGPGMRELGAEEHDQGRVVDADEEHHHRARRTIGRADASPSQARETDYP